ncbi:MAG TPA: alpha/beta hydrolase-fold protein [Steroidobacteraceae bacterium]|jgi:enterochelin esterase family protein|nr:alpha/beta hydrolase-fold protein [Steroidobacteraceae bacterium]
MNSIRALLVVIAALVSVKSIAADIPRYELTEDSLAHEGVPHGRLEGPFEFHSNIINGTVRRYWIYVPVQYTTTKPASLLVFQDGQRATNPEGSLRIPNVLDNLIAKKEIPVTIGVFITPGNLSEHYPDNLGMGNPDHRKEEYDALDDRYTRFLIDELLPEVSKKYQLRSDPSQRIIGGTSSGAICAFTVAWHRPDYFRNVISIIGSFTSIGYQPAKDNLVIPGGDLYPGMIRKTAIKPIKIFLQDGSNDLNNEHGNWFLANQQMLSSLEWANTHADETKAPGPRYVINHVWGDGNHSDNHGGMLMPDILRWMFK